MDGENTMIFLVLKLRFVLDNLSKVVLIEREKRKQFTHIVSSHLMRHRADLTVESLLRTIDSIDTNITIKQATSNIFISVYTHLKNPWNKNERDITFDAIFPEDKVPTKNVQICMCQSIVLIKQYYSRRNGANWWFKELLNRMW